MVPLSVRGVGGLGPCSPHNGSALAITRRLKVMEGADEAKLYISKQFGLPDARPGHIAPKSHGRPIFDAMAQIDRSRFSHAPTSPASG